MITLQDAYEIALSEVRVPHDAVLTYGNALSNRYVFEWKHSLGDITSETDRILIWIDLLTGNVLLKEIEWSAMQYPTTPQPTIQTISGMHTIGYREIAKSAYFTYDGSPLKDWYWVGEDASTRYIIDECGTIVGEMIPKPSGDGYTMSGYVSYSRCWDISTYTNYFEKWTKTTIHEECAPTYETYASSISDPTKLLYQGIAHSNYVESISFKITDGLTITAFDIQNMMRDRDPLPFAMLNHCQGMNQTDYGTISNAYRKGKTTDTITVGLKHTTSSSWNTYLTRFRAKFLSNIDTNIDTPIKDAYDDAMAYCPTMDGRYEFVGDTSLSMSAIFEEECIPPDCSFISSIL